MRQPLKFLAGACTFTVGLAFQISGFQNAAVGIGLMIVGLVFATVWAFPKLSRLRLRLAPTVGDKDERLTRTQTIEYAAIWPSSRAFLRSEPRSQLSIYAPTGVWERSDGKREWFGTIATCLLNADPSAPRQLLASDLDADAIHPLQAFYGIFGLPPMPAPDATETALTDVATKLSIAENFLSPLNGIATAHLRYMETNADTTPGNGMIIVDQDNVAFALAVNGRYLADYVIFMLDVPDIGERAKHWFTTRAMPLAEANILQEVTLGVDLHSGFATIRDKYGIPAADPL